MNLENLCNTETTLTTASNIKQDGLMEDNMEIRDPSVLLDTIKIENETPLTVETPKEKKKKCFIVGFAPSWKLTPWNDPDAEIWSLNEFYLLGKQCPDAKVDRWFEIHNLERPPKNNPEHLAFLETLDIPLYTLKKWDFIKNVNQEAFPFDAICDWFKARGHIGHRYFTNSISWMLGFAIMEGFEEIHVYGVDMAMDKDSNGNDEYGYQKPSCEYFLGLAEKYARVYVPETSDLLMCPMRYAIDLDNERYVYMKKQMSTWKDLNKKASAEMQHLQMRMKQLEAEVISRQGAASGYQTLLKKRL
jgi:hypothetical protein